MKLLLSVFSLLSICISAFSQDSIQNIGIDHLENGKFRKAIKQFTKALEAEDDSCEIYYNRGNAYFDLEKYSKAIIDYSNALEINPEYWDAYTNRVLHMVA